MNNPKDLKVTVWDLSCSTAVAQYLGKKKKKKTSLHGKTVILPIVIDISHAFNCMSRPWRNHNVTTTDIHFKNPRRVFKAHIIIKAKTLLMQESSTHIKATWSNPTTLVVLLTHRSLSFSSCRSLRSASKTPLAVSTWCSWVEPCWPTSWKIKSRSGCREPSMRKKAWKCSTSSAAEQNEPALAWKQKYIYGQALYWHTNPPIHSHI